LNVRDAKICLVCDEIFEGERCPRCGVDGYYLMRWVQPLYPRPVCVRRTGRPEVCAASSQKQLELLEA